MTISAKHTTDARKEIFTPCQFTGSFNHDRARRFNLVRLAESGEFTPVQIERLSTVVMISEGKGDSWTAFLDKDLGLARYNSSTWLDVKDTLLELAQSVADRVRK